MAPVHVPPSMVDRITPAELKALQDAEADFVLVDTRSSEDYEASHIGGARNVRFSPEAGLSDEEVEEAFADVDHDDRIVLICAKGISAADFVDQLEGLGYGNVQMVDDGMLGWSTVYDAVTLPLGDGLEVIQLQRRAKGCLSYVVASAPDGAAIVVDPTRHTGEVVDVAEAREYEVEAVVDTHVHADHVSGGPALADELDVPYYLGSHAAERGVEYDHKTITPNGTMSVGSARIKAVHVPGHTAGSNALLLDGTAVLTADTLHVDAVGRVELAFEDDDAEEGARTLYRSLHRTLLSLPDELAVYPGHFTVTPEGEYEHATPGFPVGSTIGELRRGLDILGLDEEAFVRRIVDDLPEEPPNYEEITAINQGREDRPDGEDAEQLELGPNNCAA